MREKLIKFVEVLFTSIFFTGIVSIFSMPDNDLISYIIIYLTGTSLIFAGIFKYKYILSIVAVVALLGNMRLYLDFNTKDPKKIKRNFFILRIISIFLGFSLICLFTTLK